MSELPSNSMSCGRCDSFNRCEEEVWPLCNMAELWIKLRSEFFAEQALALSDGKASSSTSNDAKSESVKGDR